MNGLSLPPASSQNCALKGVLRLWGSGWLGEGGHWRKLAGLRQRQQAHPAEEGGPWPGL